MLNLGKERFIGNIVVKCSFQMALISMKNLVYDKLARQNIFCFMNSISILAVLSYGYHSSSFYYYHYCFYYFFIIIIMIIIVAVFYCYHSHHYYVLHIINVICFILFHFTFYCSYYYDFVLCVVCDVRMSPHIFSLFLLIIYI